MSYAHRGGSSTRPPSGRLRRHSARLAACALWLPVAACATLFPSRDPFGGGGGVTVRLDVENQNFQAATLFLISEFGTRNGRRLGVVGGNSTSEFSVPWDSTESLSIRIEIAGGRCTTAPMVVSPGDELELQIRSDLAQTPFCR